MNQTPPPELPIEVDVAAVKAMLDQMTTNDAQGNSATEEPQTDFLLLDCREQQEYEHCSIAGAKLLPMNETPARLAELEPYRDARIVVHCHHGGRSFQVVQWLRSQGFRQAQNMTGGIDVWSQVVDPAVPRY